MSAPIKPVSVQQEEGCFDIDLPVETVALQEGGLRLIARGTVDGIAVGFAFQLGAEWKVQKLEEADLTVYWGHGAYCRLGPESDRFIALMADGYQLSDFERAPMLPKVPVQLVSIGANPFDVKHVPLRLKVFFHSGSDDDEDPEFEDRYAEVFTHVDLGQEVFGFHEKDVEYRYNLLRALTQK